MTGRIWNRSSGSPEAVAIELHLEFPAYSVIVRRDRGEPRYQLISSTEAYPYCLISADPEEIRAELKQKDTKT